MANELHEADKSETSRAGTSKTGGGTAGSGGANPVRAPYSRSGKPISKPSDRHMKPYFIYPNEIRKLGAAQFATALFGSVGTFFVSIYFDRQNDILVGKDLDKSVVSVLKSSANQAWWSAAIFFGLALILLAAQGLELSRIKSEHQEKTIWGLVSKRWTDLLTYLGA